MSLAALVARIRNRFFAPELNVLVSVVVLALGTLVFFEVADEVMEGDTQDLDRVLLLSLRNPHDLADPIGPPLLEEMARDFTALGGVALLTLLSLAVVGHLMLMRKPRAAAFVAGSVASATALTVMLKNLFDRPRPDLVPQFSHVMTASFPSGHSMLSASVYLTLGALLAQLQSNRLLKAYVLGCALTLTLLVGFSRVYVGVHWPTDVLAGWAAGAAWASLCWLLGRAMQRRGGVEQPSPGPDDSVTFPTSR
jgi:undecaprenyl-diphosphatase